MIFFLIRSTTNPLAKCFILVYYLLLFLRSKEEAHEKDEGVVAERLGKVYQYKNIEFSVVEVPGHSFYFEAEIMVGKKSEILKAKEKIRTICKSLGLKTFNDKTFFEYIHLLNGEANEKFDYRTYKEGYFKKRFGI